MREAVAEWLRAAGYRVRTAEDGNAGLASVNTATPALVVTDIHMPGANGALVATATACSCPSSVFSNTRNPSAIEPATVAPWLTPLTSRS